MPDEGIEPTGSETPPETPPETLPEPTEGQAVPWEDYKALRDENAKYRKTWQPVEKVFSDEKAQPFKAAAEALVAGRDQEVASWMVESTAGILGVTPDVLLALMEAEEPGSTDETEEPLTPEKIQGIVEQMLETRLEAERQSSQVSAIEANAQALGYTPGSREYLNLLHIATNDTDGDLEAADQAIKAERQAIIDSYLEEKRQAAAGIPRTTTGQAPGSGRKITLDNAADAAREFLEAQG